MLAVLTDAIIFKETVAVKPDTYYLFSTWILNMIKDAGYRNPAVGVQILDSNGVILVEQTLGQFIPTNRNTPEWVHIGSVIYSGTNTTLTVVFVSRGSAAGGNDYAVDDIGLYEVTMPKLISVKTSSMANANVGDVVTYTVALSNIYDRAITNVTFQDSVPNGLTFVPGSVTVNGVSQPTADPNAGMIFGNPFWLFWRFEFFSDIVFDYIDFLKIFPKLPNGYYFSGSRSCPHVSVCLAMGYKGVHIVYGNILQELCVRKTEVTFDKIHIT